jgi:cytosine/adenosine deaminase-related metal-dependent hydrolase
VNHLPRSSTIFAKLAMSVMNKVAGLLHKLWDIDYHEWLGAKEAWAMATSGGAQPMGDADLGKLTPGARADLAFLGLDSLAFTPLNDPLKHLGRQCRSPRRVGDGV